VLAIKLSVKYGKRPSSVLKINVAKFHLTNRAVTDLSDIADFTIQNFGIEQARFYWNGLNNCFEILAENPQLGRSAADLAPNLGDTNTRLKSCFIYPKTVAF
jgi:toxin ParE1/3/4